MAKQYDFGFPAVCQFNNLFSRNEKQDWKGNIVAEMIHVLVTIVLKTNTMLIEQNR